MSLPNLKQSKSTDLRNEFLEAWRGEVVTIYQVDCSATIGELYGYDQDNLLITDENSINLVPWR